MIRLEVNILGAFAIKDDYLIERELFPEDALETARLLLESEERVCKPVDLLLGRLIETGVTELTVQRPDLFKQYADKIRFTESFALSDLFELAAQLGFNKNQVEGKLAAVNLELTRMKLRVNEPDALLMQAVGSLRDTQEAVNLLSERLHEWYGLHFPELGMLVKNPDAYARLVCEVGGKENYKSRNLGLDPNQEQRIKDKSRESLGVSLDEEDLEAVKLLAASMVNLLDTKSAIEAYIEQRAKQLTPNLYALVGGVIAAKLISYAGGLNRLSVLPAGTIQVLGAEDAFFRFLKTGGKPPKHGVIFMHPLINSADKKTRGRMARTLAAKIAIAVKVDVFGGEFIGDRLSRELKARADSLKK
jgi:nucleolar protein 56